MRGTLFKNKKRPVGHVAEALLSLSSQKYTNSASPQSKLYRHQFMNIFLYELFCLFLSPGFCFSGADFSLERKSSLRPLYLDLCPYMEKCGVIVQIVWRVVYSLIFINIISCKSSFLFLSSHMFKLLPSGRCYRRCLLNMLPPQRQFLPPTLSLWWTLK